MVSSRTGAASSLICPIRFYLIGSLPPVGAPIISRRVDLADQLHTNGVSRRMIQCRTLEAVQRRSVAPMTKEGHVSETRSLDQFLDALGSSAPTPGGGAASAIVGALAAALAEMVAQLTVGRPKYAAVEEGAQTVLKETQRLRSELLALVDEDTQAYDGVATAYALPKGTDDERRTRDEAIQVALVAAMQPPLQIMERGCDVLRLASEIAEIGNPTVASDAGCAALLGEAATRAAGLNVMANVVLLRDEQIAGEAHERVAALEAQAAELRERALATVRAIMKF
jgi:formiminotetrahydrofolate cyclodeaminase